MHVQMSFLWQHVRLFDRHNNYVIVIARQAFGLGWVLTNRFSQANDTMQGRCCLATCDQSS